MELSIKQIVESEAYRLKKEALAKERNWGDVTGTYITDYSVFKKTDAEKSLAYKLRSEWRAKIQALGIRKRKVPLSYVG